MSFLYNLYILYVYACGSVGMYGYVFHTCGSWKKTFSSMFSLFIILNQGPYCIVTFGPSSLSASVLLFYFFVFVLFILLFDIFTSWPPQFSLPPLHLSHTVPPFPSLHSSFFSLQKMADLPWILTSYGISNYSSNLMVYQSASSPIKVGRGNPVGGKGPKAGKKVRNWPCSCYYLSY